MTADLLTVVREALAAELEDYAAEIYKLAEPLTEKQFWAKPIEPGNSIGHLVLHLTGNLNHFIGATLGNTGYVRDREREFTDAAPPAKSAVLANLKDAVALFRRVVGSLTAEQFAAPFPDAKFGNTMKALQHFVAHFALHRGQMTYIARLLA